MSDRKHNSQLWRSCNWHYANFQGQIKLEKDESFLKSSILDSANDIGTNDDDYEEEDEFFKFNYPYDPGQVEEMSRSNRRKEKQEGETGK
jgi:hypothetical protein